MKVLYFGRYTDCPLQSNCDKQCTGKCERLELFEEKIQEEARETLAGMREGGFDEDNN